MREPGDAGWYDQQPREVALGWGMLGDQVRWQLVVKSGDPHRAGDTRVAPPATRVAISPTSGCSARGRKRALSVVRGQFAAKEARELGQIEWLWYEAHGPAVDSDELTLAQVVCARQHDSGRLVPFSDQSGELDAVGAGEHQIDHCDIEALASHELQSRIGVLSQFDLEAVDPQPDRGHPRMVRVVVHNEQTRQTGTHLPTKLWCGAGIPPRGARSVPPGRGSK